MADQLLSGAVDKAIPFLDLDRRAWVFCTGRLVDLGDDTLFSTEQVRDFFTRGYESGDFPLGPIAYSPVEQDVQFHPLFQSIHARQDDHGEPFLESRIGYGGAGILGNALTRSGRFDTGPVRPFDVLQCDVETTLAEVIGQLALTAMLIGYRGPARFRVAVLGTDETRLRRFDDETGVVLAPQECASSFEPFTMELQVTDGLTREEVHARVYPAVMRIVEQFGAAGPQYFVDPERRGTPPPFALSDGVPSALVGA